ncbi:glycoside hydrolase family 28 protein [Gilliamella sp. ESL0405]|uniref:glycoside hydrolase family 28 protein n=1 Tax=Gilliamella sp. ESL0405 TaxID=2704653 RepID=UPI001C6A4A5D|nr:glycoside hydrolase family 28 protein [Gilliamella sp. ESL0405]QYN46145.1 glycoside hydrolase family 28 protein [Gilliamella sp. ESL0405]
MTRVSVTDFGAIGDGKSLNTHAFEKAIAHIEKQGGGTIVVPVGTYYTGAIKLCSHLTLHIEQGATLRFSDDVNDYPIVNSRWEGVKQDVYMPCIYGHSIENVTLTGGGKIDGNGQKWWQVFRQQRENLRYPRPYLIGFDFCQRITIEKLFLTQSPSWTVHPMESNNVVVDNISILNPADSPNTDGINPESCRNVRISNCYIDVGDDCIAIKAGTEQTADKSPCENILITNCNMIHGHGAVVLGSEMSGSIRHITISNCVFQKTDRGVRFKTRRGRGGTISDITFSNIVMDEVLSPFVMNYYYYCGPKGNDPIVWNKQPLPVSADTPACHNISFSNIIAKNVRAYAGFLYGIPESPITNISFDNIRISMQIDAQAGEVDMFKDVKPEAGKGFFIENANSVLLNNVIIDNVVCDPLYVKNCTDVHVNQSFVKQNGQLFGLKTE